MAQLVVCSQPPLGHPVSPILASAPGATFVRGRVRLMARALPLCFLSACGTTLAASPSPEPAPLDLTTVVAEARPVARTLRLTGTLLAGRESRLASDGSGKVLATFVERGDVVKRGDPLARLDARAQAFQNREAEAESAALDAQLQTERLECERAERLLAAGAISSAEHERLSGRCTSRRHSVQAARARASLSAKVVGDSIVRAPFDGVVAERSIDVGEYVVAGTPVATLVEIDRLRLELAVPESALAAVRSGEEVEFEVAAYPGRRFSGRLQHIGPVVRRESRDQLVEAVVDNEGGVLRPGMFAVAELRVGSSPLPVVPASALRGGPESPRVFVVNAGRVEERVVLARVQPAGEFALERGVAPGERVVAPLSDAVHDGARLR